MVKWTNFEEDIPVQNVYIILDPKWLSLLLSSVVTVRHSFVKDGVILRSDLASIWHNIPTEYHSTLIHLLNHLDVLVPLDNRELLVPCLLPETRPSLIELSDPTGEVIRRGYVLRTGVTLPVGVIGKLIAAALRWGIMVYGWRDGCIVVKEKVSHLCRQRYFI
jgi:hypothetical protein